MYNVNNTYNIINDIPEETTLASFEANLTPATGATFETYQSDSATVATDLEDGYVVIVTAQDNTTTKIYTIKLIVESVETALVYEGFDYADGAILQTQTGWTALNSGDDLLISTGNLSYTGLKAPTGNKVTFAGGGIDAYLTFDEVNAGTVYAIIYF